jgi:myo-inositol 2-dehydrogenase/D-chiro-inositol 1-dehydrogenase
LKKIKFGIIGLGRLGIQHAENIAFKIPKAELVAICDLSMKRVEEIKKQWNISYGYTNFDEMIKNKELDAVFICSPSHLHCEQIEKALEAGLHVFSEKPLGTTLEECKRAEKVVEKYPESVFMLGFMRRYDPSYTYAKKMIDQ